MSNRVKKPGSLLRYFDTNFGRLILLGLFFLVQLHFVRNHSQAIHFADELEHLSGGFEIFNQNKTLYEDISVNHQPIPFLLGYLLYAVFDPSNLYILIEWSRLVLLATSFLGAVLLTLRFGWVGLITSVIVEVSKYYFFGYHLLGESLALYPVTICGALIVQLLINPKKVTKVDDVLFGICLFLSIFSLLPNLFFVVLVSSIYIYYRRRAFLVRVIPIFLILFLIISLWVNWRSWYEETIVNVYKYFLASETQVHSPFQYLLLLIFPWLSVFNLNVLIARQYFIVFSLTVFGVISFSKKNDKSRLLALIIFYVLVISLNMRCANFSDLGWAGFHLLPQYGLIVLIGVWLTIEGTTKVKKNRLLVVVTTLLLMLGLVNTMGWWFDRRDKVRDHHIQYGGDENIGNVINSIKQPGDTLLSGSQHGGVNLTAQLPFPGRQITYFAWSYQVPRLRSEFSQMMWVDQPTFIYFPERKSPYYNDLKPYLDRDYLQFMSNDGYQSGLYVKIEEMDKRSNIDWNFIKGLGYIIPFDDID